MNGRRQYTVLFTEAELVDGAIALAKLTHQSELGAIEEEPVAAAAEMLKEKLEERMRSILRDDPPSDQVAAAVEISSVRTERP